MAIKKNTSTSKRTFNSYRTVGPKSAGKSYVYPHKDKNGRVNVPSNQYSAIIDKIKKATASSGSDSLDVFYTLQDKDDDTYYVRQRIPEDTNLMDNFLDFLVNSGVDINKVCPEDFSGRVNPVYVIYPDDTDCFGQVVYSKPYVSNHRPKKASSMDKLLSEDDEDEVEADEDKPELDELDEEDIEEYLEEE